MLAYSNTGAGCIKQADGFVRQLTRWNVAGRQRNGGFDPLVQDLHFVVLFQHRCDAAHHQNGFWNTWLFDVHHLETACQSRVFFDVFLVLGPCGGADGAQCTARQCRFQKVGRIACASRTPCPDQCVRFINEHHDGCGRGLNLVNHLAQTVFKFAFHGGTGLQ